MKYALLIFLTCASSQLFPMNGFKVAPAVASLDTIIQLYRDKNLTQERLAGFFKKPANQDTIEKFMKSAAAQYIKAQGELYTRTDDSSIEFYEMENAYAGLILLSFCSSTERKKLKMYSKACSIIKNFERIKRSN